MPTEDEAPAGPPPKGSGFGSNVFWAFVLQAGTQGFSGISSFVLAWLVGPRDFGLVSMAAVFVALFQMFLEAGLVTAIIQRKRLEPEHLDSIFWLNVVASVVLGALAVLAAPYWAEANRVPELAAVIVLLSVTIVVNGLTLVQQSLAQREQKFKALAGRSNVATAAGAAVGIAYALVSPGWTALVVQRIVTAVLLLVLLWRLGEWRPAPRFSVAHTKEMLQFSAGVLASRVAMRVSNSADGILIGLFFGPTTVGTYRLAQRVADLAYTVTTRPFSMVAMPLFAERQDRPDLIHETLITCIKYSTLVAFPVMAVVAGTSTSLVGVMGPSWASARLPLVLLAAVGVVKSITSFTDPLLFAVGKPMVRAAMVTVLGVLNPIGYALAAWLLLRSSEEAQTAGIAGAELVIYLTVFTPVNLWLARREAGLRILDVVRSMGTAALGGVVALVVSGSIGAAALRLGVHPALSLPAEGCLGLVAGFGVVYALEPDARRMWRQLRGSRGKGKRSP